MYKLTLSACFLALFIFFGCKKTNITPNNNEDIPIKIALQQVGNHLEITWQEINIANFESYTLLRTAHPTNVSLQDTTWVIDDFTKTKIIDNNLPLSEKLFYKLVLKTKDRFIESEQIAFQRADATVLENLDYDYSFANPAKKLIYLVNSTTNPSIRSLNIETWEFSKKEPFAIGSTSSTGITKATFFPEFPNHVFLINPTEIYVYDVITLKLKFTLSNSKFPGSKFLSITEQNDNFYVSTKDGIPFSFKIFNAQTGVYGNYYKPLALEEDAILRAIPTTNTVLVLPTSSLPFNFEIASMLKTNSLGVERDTAIYAKTSIFSPSDWVIAPNGKTIFSKGTFLDMNFKTIHQFNDVESKSIVQYSPNSNHALYFSTGLNYIKIIDLKTLKNIKNITNKNAFLNAFLTDNEVVTISEQTGLNGKLTIIKIKY